MDINYYKKYEPIFRSWKIVKELGEGSYGKVFEIEREDFGNTYKAALKAVTIPRTRGEIKTAMSDGMDEESVTAYFEGVVEKMVNEFALMSKIKGNSNIVSYEDHTVMKHDTDIGWDILIRMELLTPLVDHAFAEPLSRNDVVKLGIDICKALEACRVNNIIHRDIKPENIFISSLGDYKLGDFGIAKTVEKTTGGLTKTGTFSYMAPEVYLGNEYGPSVDIYSLGVVLYRYMNNLRAPFLPPCPEPITSEDKDMAMAKRMRGETLPSPVNADSGLSEIILKACAFNPEDRYASPIEMRKALEQLHDVENGNICAYNVTLPKNKEVQNSASKGEEDNTMSVFSKEYRETESGENPKPEAGDDTGKNIEDDASKAEEPEADEIDKTISALKTIPKNEPDNGNKKKKKSLSKNKKNILIGIVAAVALLIIVLAVAKKDRTVDNPSDISGDVLKPKTENTDNYKDESKTEDDTESKDIDKPELTPTGEVSIAGKTKLLLVDDSTELIIRQGDIIFYNSSNNLEWESSNESIATVENGIVTGHKVGKVTITGSVNGERNTYELQVVELDKSSKATIEADYNNLKLGSFDSDTVNMTLDGDIPKEYGATAYPSTVSIEAKWGEVKNESLELKITTVTYSECEGYVTVLVYPQDDPTHIVAVQKIKVKV